MKYFMVHQYTFVLYTYMHASSTMPGHIHVVVMAWPALITKCKNIFTKMLKDVGIEVQKSIETRSKYTMHADTAKAGDDSMQQS